MDIKKLIRNNHLKIIVKPNSRSTKILGWNEARNALEIAVEAPADKNKANIELIKFLSRLTKKKVRIVSGLSSREKLLRIE